MEFDKFLKIIGKNLREAREAKKLTQFDMMDYGFSRRQYQYIETGRRNITLKTLFRLAKIFNVSPEELIKK